MFELHTPVLLTESLDALLLNQNGADSRIFVDATVGLGGHSSNILPALNSSDRLIVIDRDSANLEKAKMILSDPRVTAIHSSFAHLHTLLEREKILKIDGILYDLGVSSIHYDEAERGFSIRENGPLDMRFDQMSTLPTAEDLIHTWGERELYRAFVDYADEPKALFIARAIVEQRTKKRIRTTAELTEIISTSSFDPKSPLRVFQAIRIAVNGEFEHIRDSLPQAIESLRPGGRLCVITFHSIEDRLVKNICK